MTPVLNKYNDGAGCHNAAKCLDDRHKCECWDLTVQLACSSTENHFQAVLLLVPVPLLLMWLPHVHGLARAELGKHFIRKKIVNRYFYRLPRTNPSFHSTPTPHTVICGEESFLGSNLMA